MKNHTYNNYCNSYAIYEFIKQFLYVEQEGALTNEFSFLQYDSFSEKIRSRASFDKPSVYTGFGGTIEKSV